MTAEDRVCSALDRLLASGDVMFGLEIPAGFERDLRNNGVTHKIDPAIDGEREYVNSTLTGTGLVIERNHVTPLNALTEAKTATGGTFNSDGRILVLILKSSPPVD